MNSCGGFEWNTGMARAARFAAAFVFTGLIPVIASADNLTELDEVRVTAVEMEERLSAELAQYGSQVEIITREDIEKTGITDVTQALESLVPGMFATQRAGKGSGDFMTLSMQGSARDNVLFMIDGVRINSRMASRPFLDSLGMGVIERIEVIKNGQSLFYGTDALNGAVNFITKKVSKDIAGSQGLSYGSLGDRGISADVSTTIDGHGVLLFTNADASDGFPLYNFKNGKDLTQSNARPVTREYNRTNLGGKYRREFGEGRIFNFLVIRDDNQNENPRSANYYYAENDRNDLLMSAKWDDVRNEKRQFFLKTSYHEWWSKWTQITGYPNALAFAANSNNTTWGYEDWGVNFMGDFKLDNNSEVIVGTDYQNSWGKDETSGIGPTKHSKAVAAFMQYRPYLAAYPDMKLALGGRYNKTVGGATQNVWNVSLKQPLMESIYFRGLIGTSFKNPTNTQRFQVSAGNIGNPNLKPEESYGFDVGIGGSSKVRNWPVRWDFGHFYQEISDLIAPDANTVQQNTNGKSRIKGFEFQVGIEPHPEWSFDGNVTFADAEKAGDPRQMEQRPTWFSKGSLKFRPSTGRSYLLYVDGIDFTGRYIGNNYEYTAGLRDLNYGKVFVGDLSAFKGFGSRKDHKLTIRVENFLNRTYTSQVDSVAAANLPAGVAAYHQENRGTPRNVSLSYNRDF